MVDIETEFGKFGGFVRNLFGGRAAELPQDAGPDDWESLLGALKRHGVQPLFQYLCEDQEVALPGTVSATLKNARKQQIVYDLLENAQLEKLRVACQAAGIPLLLLKGTALAHQFYPKAGLRPRCDTDLMVRQRDWARFHTLALSLGLEGPATIEPKLIREATYTWSAGFGVVLALDVHRELSNSRLIAGKLSFDVLYDSGRPVNDFGEGIRMLSSVYALFHACFHRAVSLTAEGGGERLIWLFDVLLIWRALSAAEQAEFVALATRLECAVLCQSGLQACMDWCALPVDDRILRELERGAANERLASRVLDAGYNSRAQAFVTDTLSQDGFRARLGFVKETLFPEPSYMRFRYPGNSPLIWLYIKRLGEGAGKLLRRSR